MTSELNAKTIWMVGEQVSINLEGIGEFTATVHKVVDNSAMFMFDDYVAVRPMNSKDTNEGGYEASDLKKWIDTELLAAFPEEIRDYIYGLRIPSVGEMFGHDDDWINETFVPDEDEQLELMKQRKYRVAYYNDDFEYGWLMNPTKAEISASSFACVYFHGFASSYNASPSFGVRPVFWLVRKPEGSCAPRAAEEEKTTESLANDISKKQDEIREMREEIERLERIKGYKEAARRTKDIIDSFCEVGFTTDQAVLILTSLITDGKMR